MPPDLDEPGIRRYLLGLLAEPEAEALEVAYLARPEVLERVRAVEDDLLDDYAADRLSAAERAAFEGRYLASPRLRQRVLAARALRHEARSTRPTAWRAVLALAAGLLLALLGYRLWRSPAPSGAPPPTLANGSAAPTPPSASPSTEPAGPTPRPTAVAEVTPAPLVLVLQPGLLRAQGAPAELRVEPGTGAVVLELERDPAVALAGSGRLDAVLATVEGPPVWRGEARRRADARRPLLWASVAPPPGRLAPGDYLLTLSAADEVLARYFFRVPAR